MVAYFSMVRIGSLNQKVCGLENNTVRRDFLGFPDWERRGVLKLPGRTCYSTRQVRFMLPKKEVAVSLIIAYGSETVFPKTR